MKTDDFYVVRCPKCGSDNLQGFYNEQAKFGRTLFMKGLIGVAAAAIKHRNRKCWRCMDCGHVFPMNR